MDDGPTQELPVVGSRAVETDDPRRLPRSVAALARLGQRRWVSAAVAMVIVVFGVLGALIPGELVEFRGEWRFDLDGENTLPALFSAALLVCGGLSLLTVAISIRYIALGIIGALLTYMALDEVLGIHERLETVTGISWQALYLPIAAVAGVAALLIGERLRRARLFLPCVALAAGGVAWVVAQLLEKLEWEGDVPQPGYVPMMVTEEILEMVGSFSFLIAGFALAIAVSRELLLPPRHQQAGRRNGAAGSPR
ncbi:hypothetical protein [Pseudonocardia sp. TRM90224]|uniref:hypothetical protein n=1 Tax=Pseudonocardia sp. TRM90224 TaxID=2812678 RepID=UPI001E4AAF90|nr:hypothetical protein [Pseudonocardia sp. TRM90224]